MSLTELALPEIGGPCPSEGCNGLVIIIVIVIAILQELHCFYSKNKVNLSL
jgi:nitrogenase subunit NifH